MKNLWAGLIFSLIIINTFLYYIDPVTPGAKEEYERFLSKRKMPAESYFDDFEKIDIAFIEKELDEKWIYTKRSDSTWFKRIRVPAKYSLSKYNLFFQKLLRDNNIRLKQAVEYEFSNKLIYSLTVNDSIPATVEIRVSSKVSPSLELHGNLALIINGFGENWGAEWVDDLLALPYDYSVSILPDRWATEQIRQKAVNNSKNILVSLPMEPDEGNIDREKYRIMKGMKRFSINFVIEEVLKEIPGAEGIINYKGGKVISDFETMDIFLRQIKNKDLIYIENHNIPNSYSEMLSGDYGISFGYPTAHFIDLESSGSELKKVIDMLMTGEDAIVVIEATEPNFKILKNSFPDMVKDINIIPLSQSIR
ncbi:MAG: divergent polysaccharide deacetylase family protein [Candidatus Delongbacteria bacterium]